jgi:hypothetical protein
VGQAVGVAERWNGATSHLVRHALLVQVTELGLIVDLDELLASRGREGDIELHALWKKERG